MCLFRYAVVCFIDEEESYSEIPTIWLSKSKKECFWPSHMKNATQLMIKYVYPTSIWTRHNVRVVGYYNTLKKARKVSESQDYTSNKGELLSRTRPNLKKKIMYSEGTSSDNESDKMTPLPTPICNSSRKQNDFQEALQQGIIFLNPDNTCTDDDNPDVQYFRLNSEETIVAGNNEFESIKNNNYKLEKVYKLQIENSMLLKTIMSKLQQIEIPTSQKKISAEKILDLEKQLPILNLNDLAAFDQQLTENTDYKDSFYNFLKGIGGNSGKEFIRRCLKAVYSNELAVGCSWLGLRGNHKIASTQSIHWIKATIKEAFATTTDKEFEKIVSEWFRLAKLRLKPHNK